MVRMCRRSVLKENVRSRVYEQGEVSFISGLTDGGDTPCLILYRIEPISTHHLIFNVYPDSSGVDHFIYVSLQTLGVVCITTFKVQRDRKVDGLYDPFNVLEHQAKRH